MIFTLLSYCRSSPATSMPFCPGMRTSRSRTSYRVPAPPRPAGPRRFERPCIGSPGSGPRGSGPAGSGWFAVRKGRRRRKPIVAWQVSPPVWSWFWSLVLSYQKIPANGRTFLFRPAFCSVPFTFATTLPCHQLQLRLF